MSASRITIGTPGDDRLTGTGRPDLIDGGLGNDLLLGGNGNDLLIGGPPVAQPGLESDQDCLVGGRGDDILIGNQDDDVLTGGSGRDVFTLATANLDFLWDAVDSFNGGGQDIVTDFHKGNDCVAVFVSTFKDFNDDPTGTYLSFAQFDTNKNGVLDAGDGPGVRIENVTHDGRTLQSTVLHLGPDNLGVPIFGTLVGDLVLHGVTDLTANDFVAGGTVADGGGRFTPDLSFDHRYVGGFDDDLIMGSVQDDYITDFGGTNTIDAGRGDDRVLGGIGDDLIRGGAGNDQLSGEGGNDVVVGGTGQDIVVGADGDDRLWGDDGADQLYGGRGDDRLVGGKGDDLLEGGRGDNLLYGGAGNDTLQSFGFFYDDGYVNTMHGGSGDDVLQSSGATDFMFGDAGNDRLLMNSGQDFLSGGQGSDRFETLNLQGDRAPVTILDFANNEDVLVLQSFNPLHMPSTSMSFDDLDTNDDQVLSAADTLLTKQSVTIDGVAKDSLVFLQIDGESDNYVPLMTFWGVTDLGRADVIG